jgi:hypothetical protein
MSFPYGSLGSALYSSCKFHVWPRMLFLADHCLPSIGGTAQMVVAMLYTFLADVTPVAERAAVFFQIVCLLFLE